MYQSVADGLYETLSQIQNSKKQTKEAEISPCSSAASSHVSENTNKSQKSSQYTTSQKQEKSLLTEVTQEEAKSSSDGFSQKKNVYIPPCRRSGYVNKSEVRKVPELKYVTKPEFQSESSEMQSELAMPCPSSSRRSGWHNVRKDYERNQKGRNIPDSKYVRKQEFFVTGVTVLKEKTTTNYSENDGLHVKTENIEPDTTIKNDFLNLNRDLKNKWLEDLDDKDPLELVEIVGENLKQFESVLKQTLKPNLIIMVFKVIVKLCKAEVNDTVITGLSHAFSRVFIDQLSNHILQLMGSQKKDINKEIILEDVIIFLETMAKLFPTRMADGFHNLFTAMNIWMKFCDDQDLVDTNLKYRFEHAKQLHKTCVDKQILDKKKEQKLKSKNVQDMPKESFRKLRIFPEVDDIVTEKSSFIRPNIINGSYESVEHYLDIQFRLLREDFLAPLREGISEYRNTSAQLTRKINNVRIYRKVKFLKPNIERRQVGLIVSFDPDNLKNIDWENSKWFMFGSLLLFSRDSFNTIIFATVIERNNSRLKKGQIVVNLEGNTAISNELFIDEFVMAESEVFFEPYHHVLKALCEMNEYKLPMQKYILNVETSSSVPRYIAKNKNCVSVAEHFYDLDDGSWPNYEELGLDESQYNAVRSALTKEFVIIQGPPGTGKTFIGLKIADILLQNSHLWNQDGRPLVVLCYTNHALDQFLEKLLPFTKRIVRIGGQSKSEALKNFSLRTKREFRFKTLGTRQLNKLISYNVNILVCEISAANDRLEKLCNGIVSFSVLEEYGVLGQNVQYFNCNTGSQSEECFINWLMYGMYDCISSHDEEVEKSNGNELPNQKVSDCIDVLSTVHIEWHILQSEFENLEYYDEDDIDHIIFTEFCEECSRKQCYECRRRRYVREDLMELRRNPHLWNMLEYLIKVDTIYFCHVTLALNVNKLERVQKKLESKIKNIEVRSLKEPNLVNQLHILQQNHEFIKLQIQYTKRQLRVQGDPDREFIENLLQKDLHQLETQERWTLYRYWIKQLRIQILDEIQLMKVQLERITSMSDEIRQINDLDILQDSLVVGITTTGAARLQSLMQTLNAPIVIVEEAAEVMESHIVASLSEGCEHLILIGDHKQLRPSPAVYKLAREYDFDVSLFERMIKNGISCDMLKLQHRMRPEISQLITPIIYPDLQNHPEVLKFEKVKGVLKSVFFLTHNQLEDKLPDSCSHRNPYEADFLLAFCCYLIEQGYHPTQITVLATYSGQMFYLQNEQRRKEMLTDVRITVVDNFQGEENDIILLSLVRSNKEANIGFLSVENRVCVALSRAKIGLYIIGNMDNLIKSSDIWPKIKETLKKQEAIDTFLTLRCQIHASEFTRVRTYEDFSKLPNGCCSQVCGAELECGHSCVKICHLSDRKHENYTCQEACARTPEKCVNNHKCKKLCWMKCENCPEVVTKTFPCGHTMNTVCSDNRCTVDVDVELPDCGHKVKKPCYVKLDEFQCTEPCEDRVPCGHSCNLRCHKMNDPDHLEYTCKKPCVNMNKNCKENHKCMKPCYEECGDCDVRVLKTLPGCDHKINLLCSEDSETYLCKENCEKILHCGHLCPRLCSEFCRNCQVQVTKYVVECGHSVQMKCCQEPDRSLCKNNCSRTLMCGHPCPRLCCEKCGNCQVEVSKTMPACQHTVTAKCCEINQIECMNPCNKILPCGHKCLDICSQMCDTDCKELVESLIQSPCGHSVKVPCYIQLQNIVDTKVLQDWCQISCESVLLCGHPCGGTCKICNMFHKVCENKCDKILVCGHRCNMLCSELCMPCKENCLNSCKHMICSRQCGIPCIKCMEPCDWTCKHKQCSKLCYQLCDREPCDEPCDKLLPCNHPCIGYCGETCPPFCRICNEDEIIEIVGSTASCDSRYVYLEDCGHILEENVLAQKEGEIKLNVCPHCEVPIVKTQRYRNRVKSMFENIIHLKYYLYSQIQNNVVCCEKLADQMYLMGSKFQTFVEGCKEYKATYDMLLTELTSDRSIMDFSTLIIRVELFTKLCSCIGVFCCNLNEVSRDRVFIHMDILLHFLRKADRITHQQIEDFRMELNRCHHLCQMLTIKHDISSSNSDMKNCYELAYKIVSSNQKFTRNKCIKTEQMLRNIRKINSRDKLKSSVEEYNEKVAHTENFQETHEKVIVDTIEKLNSTVIKLSEVQEINKEKSKSLVELHIKLKAVINSLIALVNGICKCLLSQKNSNHKCNLAVIISQYTDLKKEIRGIGSFKRLTEMRKIFSMNEEMGRDKVKTSVVEVLSLMKEMIERVETGKSQYVNFRSELAKFMLLINKLSDFEVMGVINVEICNTSDALKKTAVENSTTQEQIITLWNGLKSKSEFLKNKMATIIFLSLTEDMLNKDQEFIDKVLKMLSKSTERLDVINVEMKTIDNELKNMIEHHKTRVAALLKNASSHNLTANMVWRVREPVEYLKSKEKILKEFTESDPGTEIKNLLLLKNAVNFFEEMCGNKMEKEPWDFDSISLLQKMINNCSLFEKIESYQKEISELNKIAENVKEMLNMSDDSKREIVIAHEMEVAALNDISADITTLLSLSVNSNYKTADFNALNRMWQQLIDIILERGNHLHDVAGIVDIKQCFENHEFIYEETSFKVGLWYICPNGHFYFKRKSDVAFADIACAKCHK